MSKHTKLRTVDTSKLVPYVAPSIWRRVTPELEKDLLGFPETLERLHGVVHFCSNLGYQASRDESNADTQLRRKFLRAALAEYASLDEAAGIDSKVQGTQVSKMLDLDDPRIHIVRLLRHANIHLAVSEIDQSSREASWADQEFTFQIYYSPSIDASIRQTNQASNYLPDDLSKMIEWIELEQMEWGLDHLVFRTAELYVSGLLP